MAQNSEWLLKIEKEKQERSGKLDLSGCGLTSIPAEILEIDWLSSLFLQNNQIKKIENVNHLKELSTLWLEYNQVDKIENINGLSNLLSLSLVQNKITKIENVKELKELRNLFLLENQISRIENLEGLEKLNILELQVNQISKIENLGGLKSLSRLDLSNNQISKIENLDKLQNLVKLDLNNNQIAKIENLENLQRLEDFSAVTNQVEKIEGLERLKNLKKLSLDNNNITIIENISGNKLLSRLNLNTNKISSIKAIEHQPELEFLALSSNQIDDISVLATLSRLNELYIGGNNLKNIDVLEHIPSLKKIFLSNSGVTTLKPLLPAIKSGIPVKLDYYFEDKASPSGIYIEETDQLDIPIQVVKQGNEAIIQFYSLQANKSSALDEIFLNEAKLILVGEGKTGKSSLRIKLINEKAALPKEDERTRGIDIDDYSFRLKNQENYKAHIWDFGGQNIQYALHRFFMTENSLYILMTESRNERDKNFMYWFQNIDLFGGKDSPILIVMNLMFGDRGANIDIASYAGEFKKIVNNEILEINLLNPEQDNGLQKLRNIIEQQLENLPHIRKPIFRCWLDVRQALQEEAKQNPYISIELYQKICIEKGVEKPYFGLLGKYLHNLGIVLWYHDKEFLRNKMILNPLWAITAIYKIIDDKKIQDNKGKFDNNDRDRLWNQELYEFSKDELTSLLKVFKICFQRQNKNEYIVPALMDANPPAIAKEWDKDGCKTVTFEYSFMPKGIANQLTADMNQHIIDELNHVWAYGVVLHYAEDTGTSSMITENTYNRYVSIQIKGNYANRFMGIIIQELKNINNSYMGLKSEMKIPCTCTICDTHAEPQLYTEKTLIEKLNEGKTNVYCNRLDDKVDIQPILESIGITHPLFKKSKQERMETSVPVSAQGKMKVFVSYAHAQAEYFSIFNTDLKAYLKMPGIDFEIFDDFQIPVGAKWDDFLQGHVSRCDIMILLVSQEFINSDYIQKKEFGGALERLKNKNDILLVPVYFTPCYFNEEEDLSALQFFKPGGSNYDHANRDTNFSYIDLVKFAENDGRVLPNANRKRYMLDFVDKLKKSIVKK